MILTGIDIERAFHLGELGITPFIPANLQPASMDLRLDSLFGIPADTRRGWRRWVPRRRARVIDLKRRQEINTVNRPWIDVPAHGFMLASTIESVCVGTSLVGRLEGKSSLARVGLMVHVTAGFFDPGFSGYPTLELVNVRRRPIRIYAGMPVAQMSFERTSSPAEAYDGKYQDQPRGPVASRFHLNFQ